MLAPQQLGWGGTPVHGNLDRAKGAAEDHPDLLQAGFLNAADSLDSYLIGRY
jgi:hypothetical protein